MPGGTNGPSIYDGAPYSHGTRTLAQLRNSMMIRLGFAAQLASPPPGMTELLNDFLQDSQRQMYERHSPLRNIIWWPIQVEEGERHYGIPTITTGEITASFVNSNPDTITRPTGSFIADGFTPGMVVKVTGGVHDGLSYTLGAVTATTLTVAEEFISADTSVTVTINTPDFAHLEERKILEQWVQDDSQWNQMFQGIDPVRFNETSAGYPQVYEWKRDLEIWPAPDHSDYVMWVKGHFGLFPFADDGDVCTINPDLVFLHALGNAKEHYGQPSRSIFGQLEVHLRKLVAADHGNRRYVPRPHGYDDSVLTKPEATWRP